MTGLRALSDHRLWCPTVVRLVLGLVGLAASSNVVVAGAAPPGRTTAPAGESPSAIGSQSVAWLSVSPAYKDTGLVVAMAAPFQGCSGPCGYSLWVTHDGGARWQKPAERGWSGGRPVIGVDAKGHETLWAATGTALQRSDDDGENWAPAGQAGGGLPALPPNYAGDNAVAMANGGQDFLVRNSGLTKVPGSGGKFKDFAFAYSPTPPSAGGHAVALLAAMDAHNLPVVERCGSDLACSNPVGLPGATANSSPISIHPSTAFASDGVAFAQSGLGIYKSVDGGSTFAPLTILPTNGAAATATPMLALAPGYAEAGPTRTAFAAVFQIYTDPKDPRSIGGVYRTDDGGATWRPTGSPSPLDGGSMAVAVAPDGRLFAGYVGTDNRAASAGLLCSADGGATWHASCPAVGSRAVSPGKTTPTPSSGRPAQCTSSCSAQAGGDQVASPGAAAVTSTDTPASAGVTGSQLATATPATPTAASSGVGRWGLVALACLALAALASAIGLMRWRRRIT